MFYLAELIGNFKSVCTAFAIVFSLASIVGWIGRAITCAVPSEYDETDRKIFKLLSRYATIFGVVFIMSAVVLPSKKTYLLMMGGRIVDLTIDNNPEIKHIPEKTIDLLNAWIEEETEELKNKKSAKQQ